MTNPALYKTQHHYTYKIGDYTTASKLESFQRSGRDLWRIDLDWNDAFWQQQDWREPPETIDQLQQDLARRIAAEFKRIYVLFSGGWDSWTVIDAFYRAGVKIHGLIVVDRTYILREEIAAIRDKTQYIKQHMYPEIDVRWLTWTAEKAADTYKHFTDDWIYSSASLSTRLGRVDREQQFLSDRIAAGAALDDDSIVIDGIDKPRLDFVDGHWHTRFTDRYLEWFRGSPSFPFFINTVEPRIHIKQCHLLRKWMLSQGIKSHKAVHQAQLWQGQNYENFNRAIGRVDPNTWILTSPYIKHFDDSQLGIQMAINNLKSYSELEAERILKIWQTGITKLKHELEDIATDSFYFAPPALSPAIRLPDPEE